MSTHDGYDANAGRGGIHGGIQFMGELGYSSSPGMEADIPMRADHCKTQCGVFKAGEVLMLR